MNWKTQLQKSSDGDHLTDIGVFFVCGGFVPCPNKAATVLYCRRAVGIILSVSVIVVTIVIITGLILVGDQLTESSLMPAALAGFEGFLVPLAISLLNIAIPLVVQVLVSFEKYDATVTLQQTLIRIYILNVRLCLGLSL